LRRPLDGPRGAEAVRRVRWARPRGDRSVPRVDGHAAGPLLGPGRRLERVRRRHADRARPPAPGRPDADDRADGHGDDQGPRRQARARPADPILHIYGRLDLAAVTRSLPLEPGADGTFSLPPELA